jgi:hypothetical protein
MCEKVVEEQTMVCFDFHHVDASNKKDSIGNMLSRNTAIDKLQEEADKCILLCACCHRLHHQEHGY